MIKLVGLVVVVDHFALVYLTPMVLDLLSLIPLIQTQLRKEDFVGLHGHFEVSFSSSLILS